MSQLIRHVDNTESSTVHVDSTESSLVHGDMYRIFDGVLNTAGISNKTPSGKTTQADLFAAMNAVQIIFSFTGSAFVDRIGRRPMLIWVNLGCAVCWVGVTAAAGVQASKGDKVSSGVCVAMIYLFQVVYSFGWTPLQALYPVEVLSFEMRAKGMAFSNMFVTIGTMVNQFGFPVALQNAKWKTYPVFIVWCVVQSFIIWYFIPETKNRTVSCHAFTRITESSINNLLSLRSSTRSSTPRILSNTPFKRRNSNSTLMRTSLVCRRLVTRKVRSRYFDLIRRRSPMLLAFSTSGEL